jgi:hypothetical protein
VRVDGGTNVPLPAGFGSLVLAGNATAASNTQVGGGAGYRLPGGDVQFTSFNVVIDESTLGPGGFGDQIFSIPINPNPVAVTTIISFHVNEVDDIINIPVDAVLGEVRPGDFDYPYYADLLVDHEVFPYENHAVVVRPWSDPPIPGKVLPSGENDLRRVVIANVSVIEEEYHVRAYHLEAPFDMANVTDTWTVDTGIIFSLNRVCALGEDRLDAAYIKWNDGSSDIFRAHFDGEEWTAGLVADSRDGEYYSVSCFATADGHFLAGYNDLDGTVVLFRRQASGEYRLWRVLDSSDLGGAPGSPFVSAVGQAGDLSIPGRPFPNQAVLTTGMADGSLRAVQLTTSDPPQLATANLGPADGMTSTDIYHDPSCDCLVVGVDWQNRGELWHARWPLDEGPGAAERVNVSTMEPGTVIPEYQVVAGAGAPDGFYYIVADKCYQLDYSGGSEPLVEVIEDYLLEGHGGPVDVVFAPGQAGPGFVPGPGSQLVGILKLGPETGDLAVPAVARVQGAGAFFTSVMHLFNAGETDLGIGLTFTPREGSGGETTTVTHIVPAGVQQTIADPLESLFGFSGPEGRVGSVLITGDTADLMVQTVVFARLDSGEEYGQFFPALAVADAVDAGQTVYLNTTEDPVTNRVNVGLMAVADGTRFEVRPVDPLGSPLAEALVFDLDRGGNTQINNLHNAFGLGSAADVVVEVEVVSGAGLTYASVLDGNIAYEGTSDPTTILPVPGGSDRVTLLEIGSIQGVNEFSGSASITNFSAVDAEVRANFRLRGSSEVAASETLNIPAGDTWGYSDLADELFGVSGDVGTVVFTATNEARIGATGREFAIFRDAGGEVIGTAGQLMAGLADEDRLDSGRTHHFIGLRQAGSGSAVERSHLAVYNPTANDATITVRLFDGATGTAEGERSWTIPARTLIQINNIVRQVNAAHDEAEKRIEVVSDRRVFMNVFRVNVWGDPVTLSAFGG